MNTTAQRLFQSGQSSLGFALSYLIYYGLPFHHRVLAQIYAPFIRPGDLCFDIGAHLGDRIHAWSRLGARVVALEPHPGMISWLQRWYGRREEIVLLEKAAGARPGRTNFWISRLTPSVSTVSHEWLTTVRQNRRFAGVRWEEQVSVSVTTLEELIAQYGKPAFCKIDVEGGELAVLEGLQQPLAALSFEFIPAVAEIAMKCIERLSKLGEYEYNWRVTEWPRWRSPHWLSPREMAAQLRYMPRDGDSGDVYARLVYL
jgi:FkbM family methyltransferase